MKHRFLSVALFGLCLGIGCSASGSRDDPRLASLDAALDGHPDDETQAALRVLVTALNAEDWGYVTYAQWPDDGGIAALSDPTFQKAMTALLADLDRRGSSPLTIQAPPIRIEGEQQGGNSDQSHLGLESLRVQSEDSWTELYKLSTLLLARKNGLDYASTPGAATAWLILMSGALSNNAGSPLPDPKEAADGRLDNCGKYFFGSGPNCSAVDFCCNGEIDLKTGATFCHDFTSCRGTDAPPPMLSLDETGQSDPGDTEPGNTDPVESEPGDGSNPCFDVDGDPAPWIDACEHLNPKAPHPLVCLDGDASLHVSGPTLENGQNPAQVCAVFTNEDGVGTSLGMATGCDHDTGNFTCYCCP